MIRSSLTRYCGPLVVALSLYALLGSAISFCGWAFDVPRLTDWENHGISIQPNACVLLMLAAAGLLGLAFGRWRMGLVLGAVVGLVGGLTLAQYIVGADFGFNHQLLFGRPWGHGSTVTPGRVGPPASTSFTLLGAALLMLAAATRAGSSAAPRLRRWVPIVGLLICTIMLFSLLGYLFGAEQFYSLPGLSAIALQTSTMLLALAVALILLVPDQQPVLLLREQSGAGAIARLMLPAVILLPPLIVLARSAGYDAGWYDRGTSRTLGALAMMILMTGLMWMALMALRRREQRLDEQLRLNKSITDNATTALFILDEGQQCVFMNPAAEQLTGFTFAEVRERGGALHDIVHLTLPDGSPHSLCDCPIVRAFRTRNQMKGEEVFVHRDGHSYPVEFSASPLRDETGQARGTVIEVQDITARKQAEQELRQREERLQKMINIDAVGVLFFDRAGTMVDCNDAFLTMTGYSREEVTAGKYHWRDMTPPEYIEISQQQLEQFSRSGRIGPYEKEYFRKDGSRMWMLFAGADLGDGTIIEYCLDISAHKAAEEAVRRQSDMIRIINDNTEELIFMKDTEGRLTYANAATLRAIGRTPDTFAVLDRENFINPDEHAEIRGNDVRVVTTGEAIRTEEVYTSPDGVERVYLSTKNPLRNERGEIVGVVGVSRDVTDLKQAEHDLREALADTQLLQRLTMDMARPGSPHELYERLLDAAVEIMHADFASLQMLYPERGAAGGKGELCLLAHRGFPRQTAKYWEWVGADRASTCGIALLTGERCDVPDLPNDPRISGEDRAMYLEMEIRAVQTTPLIARDGHMLGAISTHWKTPRDPQMLSERDWRMLDVLAQHAADLLERVKTEQALRDADRRKDEFLATLAHELRNPLAPIRNGLHILRLAGTDAAAQEQLVEMMDRQVSHMVRLVDDLLEVSRITRGKIELRKETVELAAVIRSAIENASPAIEAAAHQLAISLPPTPVLLYVDPVRLTQVVANLLSNAAKYTEEGGQIWLTARQEEGQAVIAVRDTGTGIPAEMLPRVFDLFTQIDRTLGRAQGGLGIGLALVKSLIEMHGGSVAAHSDGPGRGSEFSVRLPILAKKELPLSDGKPPLELLQRASAGQRVLVVDDNRDAANTLAMLLRTLGLETRTAYDGPSALEAVRAYRPSAVFLDIGMPGMDGYAVAAQIRSEPQFQQVLLIALTGWEQEDDKQRSQQAGFDHHLVKPPAAKALQALLATLSEPDVSK